MLSPDPFFATRGVSPLPLGAVLHDPRLTGRSVGLLGGR